MRKDEDGKETRRVNRAVEPFGFPRALKTGCAALELRLPYTFLSCLKICRSFLRYNSDTDTVLLVARAFRFYQWICMNALMLLGQRSPQQSIIHATVSQLPSLGQFGST